VPKRDWEQGQSPPQYARECAVAQIFKSQNKAFVESRQAISQPLAFARAQWIGTQEFMCVQPVNWQLDPAYLLCVKHLSDLAREHVDLHC
jgi:hypothetical protein